MGEPDYGATQALRRASPAWAWVRKNVTPSVILSVGGMMVAGVGGAMAVTHQLGEMQADLKHLTEAVKASQANDKEFAMLQQKVTDLAKEVDEQKARWDHVDQLIDTGPHRSRR